MRTTTFATLLAAVTAVFAAPNAAIVSKRQGPSFYLVVCTEPDLGNYSCYAAPDGLNSCSTFPAPFNDNIASLASTYAEVACTVYVNDDCTGDSLVVENLEEYSNLEVSNPNLYNALSSWECANV